jgi:hypothetical protein
MVVIRVAPVYLAVAQVAVQEHVVKVMMRPHQVVAPAEMAVLLQSLVLR